MAGTVHPQIAFTICFSPRVYVSSEHSTMLSEQGKIFLFVLTLYSALEVIAVIVAVFAVEAAKVSCMQSRVAVLLKVLCWLLRLTTWIDGLRMPFWCVKGNIPYFLNYFGSYLHEVCVSLIET